MSLISHGMTKLAACEIVGVQHQAVTEMVLYDEEFQHRYRQARIEQAHAMADECIAIAEEDCHGDMAAVQRNRLRVDTRKWLTSKIAPKLYGERIMTDHTHKVGVVLLPALPNAALENAISTAATVREVPKQIPAPSIEGKSDKKESP